MKRPRTSNDEVRVANRPRTRVEEVRVARGYTKAQLCRISGMRPQTLQRIEDGSTKTLSATARRMLAPALQVREDQLLVPVGRPIEPLEGESPPMLDLIYQALLDVAAELRMLREMLQQMPKREI